MSNTTQRLINVLESGEVQRFHCVPAIPCQSVGQHAWGAALIALYIIGQQEVRPQFLSAVLLHDAGELITGDIPFTAKRGCFQGIREELDKAEAAAMDEHLWPMPELTRLEEYVMKLADMIEGMRWASHNERPCRITGGQVVAGRWVEAIKRMFDDHLIFQLHNEQRERAYECFRAFAPLGSIAAYTSFKGYAAVHHRNTPTPTY